ncbi:MAG: helix-turn-helix domain-containing protein [Lachnospiraceae bacterium]|jgi:transcriptional regulator with XRE-family HTH domain|nr:helix-turn-helix domain-containing protein [Lachnospiraceae bacterium]
MGIGYRIKEARERLNLTQTELGDIVGVTGSAITNYEKETSHPKEQIIYKLIEALKVDANYLFQDCVKLSKEANDVTLSEYDHIKKYRELDAHGKKMVDFTLNEEWERSAELAKENAEKEQENLVNISKYTKEGENENNTEELIPTKDYLLPNAAHADESLTEITEEMIQAEDDIMDNL